MKRFTVFLSIILCITCSAYEFKNISRQDLEEFVELYSKRPIQNNTGGMKSVGLFWVWYVVKTINPELIVESGIWKGQSTWILEQAAPNATIISIDPSLHFRNYISKRVTYHSQDFSQIDFGDIADMNALVFFDDHCDAPSRVIQAHSKGFQYLIFDDNYPSNKGGHCTLQECFLKDTDRAHLLSSLIKQYVILPQISGGKMVRLPSGYFSAESLSLVLSAKLDIFRQESSSYRWPTYIELQAV